MEINLKICNDNEFKLNSYVLSVGNSSIVIDPNNYLDIKSALGKNTLEYIFLTHEHFDHIMALNALKDEYDPCIIAQSKTSTNITCPTKNLSRFSGFILEFMNINPSLKIDEIVGYKADVEFDESFGLDWHGFRFKFYHTPGHSEGSSCIIVNNWLFCGDSLFSHAKTSFIGGSRACKAYEQKSLPFFNSLDKNMQVFAGHYDSFLLKDAFIFKN